MKASLIHQGFQDTVRKYLRPDSLHSGTGELALWLYSLIRCIRPRTVLEFGSGYSTAFLAQALCENAANFHEEKRKLESKSTGVGLPGGSGSLDELPREELNTLFDWLSRGEDACMAAPGFYLADPGPYFHCFEAQPADHPYSRNLEKMLSELELGNLTDLHFGDEFSGLEAGQHALAKIPEDHLPIDLAWNDYHFYREFFLAIWPHLNPDGGMLVFHSTSNPHYKADVEWIADTLKDSEPAECFTLFEPARLMQNGCTVLRKTRRGGSHFLLEQDRDRIRRELVELLAGVEEIRGPARQPR
ncbi:MAG: class I SAM-dependent methyltransferase [Candidatus Binatia bacterium]|nr:class I SAM-dependent methyltransferase [Candidatus Binatia bacterium]